MHLGEKLKIYRRSKDLDQPEMADLVGVGYRTYQEIERTGIVTKAKVHEKIREILEDKTPVLADENKNLAMEPAVDYSKHEPLTRQEISEMIHTNKMQAEAILHLSKAISSNALALASSPSPETKRLLHDPSGQMRGKSNTGSDEKANKQKDTEKS